MDFKFRKNANIGVAQAELDSNFLYECFVDNGDLDVALDTENPRMFINGRTGTGKTALLLKIAEQKSNQVIEINPEELSLNHISNSNILKFFDNIGVRLDPFFKLLWQHVLAVELIKKLYDINSEKAKKNFLERIMPRFKKDKNKERAIKYLREWGEKFWEETEYRVKETKSKIERELNGAFEVAVGKTFKASTKGAAKFTDEEIIELKKRAQEVVNKVQLRELNEIVKWLSDESFDDDQRPYYILIDRLDEDWIEERLRYKLIVALLESAKVFYKIKNLKVLIALRKDLLERVFKINKGNGYQEEKYQSLYLDFYWNKSEIVKILDLRIAKLVKEQYTQKTVKLSDLLPGKINKEESIKYIIDRTFLRPRDAILFINSCISYCTDKPKFTQTLINTAELEYSKQRLTSIRDEWISNYPRLLDCISILCDKLPIFGIEDINESAVADLASDILSQTDKPKDKIWYLANDLFCGQLEYKSFRKQLVSIFYKVGFVGLKKRASDPKQWCYINEPTVMPSELTNSCRIYIHKAFWKAFRIKQGKR